MTRRVFVLHIAIWLPGQCGDAGMGVHTKAEARFQVGIQVVQKDEGLQLLANLVVGADQAGNRAVAGPVGAGADVTQHGFSDINE